MIIINLTKNVELILGYLKALEEMRQAINQELKEIDYLINKIFKDGGRQ